MAITVTVPHKIGLSASTPTYNNVFNVVLDASYPTGGELLGLQARIGAGKTIASVICQGIVTSSGDPDLRGYQYNYTTDKIMGVLADGTAEVANTEDLSTVTVKVIVTSY